MNLTGLDFNDIRISIIGTRWSRFEGLGHAIFHDNVIGSFSWLARQSQSLKRFRNELTPIRQLTELWLPRR